MLAEQTKPVWMQPITLRGWPTEMVSSHALRYRIAMCSRWQLTPIHHQTDFEQEHVYMGALPGEMLTVSHMDNAHPDHNLHNWVNAFIQLTKLPSIHLRQIFEPPPTLIEWQQQSYGPMLKAHLKADELCLYSGLLQTSNEPTYSRLYAILARHQNRAWKVLLSLPSACLPGSPKALIEGNDHIRAGASLGSLTLLS